jgi:hypothetical protein
MPTSAYAGIGISVNDGSTTASLAAFSIAVQNVIDSGSGGGSLLERAAEHATYKSAGKTCRTPTCPGSCCRRATSSTSTAPPYKTYVALKAGHGANPSSSTASPTPHAALQSSQISGSGAVYAADRDGYDNTGQFGTRNGEVFLIWWGQGGWANIPQVHHDQNLRITGHVCGDQRGDGRGPAGQNCRSPGTTAGGIFVSTKNDVPTARRPASGSSSQQFPPRQRRRRQLPLSPSTSRRGAHLRTTSSASCSRARLAPRSGPFQRHGDR